MKYLLFAIAFMHSAAHATGLPPWEEVEVVDADCEALEGPSRKFFVTFDRYTGNCAPPGPDGDSCSTELQASLSARPLRLWRRDCAEPLPGRFVRAGQCGERPRWRWQGRLDAGHTLSIGRGFEGVLATVQIDGSMSTAKCPREGRRTHPVRTAVQVTAPLAPRWIAFPTESYAVAVEGDEARLQFTPGPALEHWFLRNDDVVF